MTSNLSISARRWIVGGVLAVEIILILAQVMFALFAPENILDRSPFLNDLTVSVGRWIPALAGYKAESRFPQASVVFYVLSFVFIPIQLIAWSILIFISGLIPNAQRMPSSYQLGALVISVWIFISLAFLPKDPSFVGQSGPSSSRIGLAVFGTGQFFILWLMAGTLVGELSIFAKEKLND